MSRPAGVWLGVDYGSVRIGVARCDPHGILATALTTVAADRRRGSDVAAVAALVAEYDAVGVVVGLPRTLRGEFGPAADAASAFAADLAKRIEPLPVELADERLTTVSASRKLADRGVRARRQRAIIDAAAAVEILQGWLDGHIPRRPETG